MKRIYLKPEMMAVRILHGSIICGSVKTVSSNLDDLYYGGESNENNSSARTKESYNIWDDEW